MTAVLLSLLFLSLCFTKQFSVVAFGVYTPVHCKESSLFGSSIGQRSLWSRPGCRRRQTLARQSSATRTSISMGLQVTIRIVGRKSSEKWIEQGIKMYETRLKGGSGIAVQTIWHKNNEQLVKGVATDRAKQVPTILLDPLGKMKSSEQFTKSMYNQLEAGGSRLSYVIGGAEGLPDELRNPSSSLGKPVLMSLSNLTFTHQFARLVLIEQIYRASEIRKGSSYHK